MPTLLRAGPYRVFVYSGDGGEPAHVHVERNGKIAKLWLEPVRLASSGGFARAELRNIARMVEGNRAVLLEHWNEHFGG